VEVKRIEYRVAGMAALALLLSLGQMLQGETAPRFPLQSSVNPTVQPASVVDADPAKRNPGLGDTPQVASPLATDLSPALTRDAIAKAMRKVGDWQIHRSQPYFSQDWTYAALYRGVLAASNSLPDAGYRDAMAGVGKKFGWQMGPRITVADDQAIGKTYLDLYRKYHASEMLAPTREQLNKVMKLPDVCTEGCPTFADAHTPVWWWADALFMAPPVWADLYRATGNISYLNYMDHEWWVTSRLLYDPKIHFFTRDASYLNKHEPNGQKIFWCRGNGWVMAGISMVLEAMPQNYPTRQKYVEQFRQMAARVAALQGEDGLWRPGLLDAKAYPLPEVSGSAFFVYAMAWGIHHGILDRATYMPVVEKGWKGLVSHIYADGRLGCIQPIGAAPDAYQPQSSYVYGVGAFLLAGSELEAIAHSGNK